MIPQGIRSMSNRTPHHVPATDMAGSYACEDPNKRVAFRSVSSDRWCDEATLTTWLHDARTTDFLGSTDSSGMAVRRSLLGSLRALFRQAPFSPSGRFPGNISYVHIGGQWLRDAVTQIVSSLLSGEGENGAFVSRGDGRSNENRW
eukprot:Polyplicarium_translucidae@DN5583_c0_g1_i1.p1